jgi:hypothetical protein
MDHRRSVPPSNSDDSRNGEQNPAEMSISNDTGPGSVHEKVLQVRIETE